MAHLVKLFTPFAREHNLTLIAFGTNITDTFHWPASGTLEFFDAWDSRLEPAPITPTDTSAYRVLSGSIRATHAKSILSNEGSNKMVVAPNLAGGNTGLSRKRGLTYG
jgi:Gly-Xaa carboxypeptidase